MLSEAVLKVYKAAEVKVGDEKDDTKPAHQVQEEGEEEHAEEDAEVEEGLDQ